MDFPHTAFRRETVWHGSSQQTQEEDQAILTAFETVQPWGLESSIDLHSCHPALIRDPAHLRAFLVALCEHIHMRRFGEPWIERFGDEPRVEGLTGVQLIQTSNIGVHLIDVSNGACINVFSCSAYPPHDAALFCQRWFQAQDVRLTVSFRGLFAEQA